MNREIEHGGRIYQAAERLGVPVHRIVDFSASLNPLGPPKSVLRAIKQILPDCRYYPDAEWTGLRHRLAAFHGISADSIAIGNGSIELIRLLPRALQVSVGYVLGPTFMEFERSLRLAGASSHRLVGTASEDYRLPLARCVASLDKSHPFSAVQVRPGSVKRIVFVCNPNSPTGSVIPRDRLEQLCREMEQKKIWLVIDEAFIDFCAAHSMVSLVARYKYLLILRSFTKFYGMPGIRLGYVIGRPEVIRTIRPVLPPWSVNQMAQVAGVAALEDEDFRRRTLVFTDRARNQFVSRLRTLPELRVYPSDVNFILVGLPRWCSSRRIQDRLFEQGVLVRDCRSFSGMREPAFRLAVRRPSENRRLVTLLKEILVRGKNFIGHT
jgi:threonine-phosphate decarboxylase